MKLQTQLLLFASIFVALIMSRGVVVVAGGTQAAMPAHAALLRGSVEDDVVLAEREEAAAYPQRRVLYSPQDIGYGALEANKAACYGSCPGRGQAYTGRGCQAFYGCRGR
ncbi:hypothetical protein ACQ4PT_008786 [Festuca glaucescens]